MADKSKFGAAFGKDRHLKSESGNTISDLGNRKSDFRKVTCTLPPELYKQLMATASERKIEGYQDATASAIIREALEEYFSPEVA